MSYSKETALVVKNLTVSYSKYGSTIKALSDVTVHPVSSGSWTFITGRNGSGKSSLLKAITHEIRQYEGAIEIFGINNRQLSASQRSKLVFMVSQNPSASTIDELTVFENIGFSVPGKKRVDIQQALDEFGFSENPRQLVKYLSGGQRQLLSLVIASLRHVKLLLLDEPFAALDSLNASSMFDMVRELHHQGTTIMFVTHDRRLYEESVIPGMNVINLDNSK